MKIKYEIDDLLKEDEIIIKVKRLTPELLELQNAFDSKPVDSLFGVKEGKTFPIKINAIERIYSHNRKTILLSNGNEYETKKTLTELENSLGNMFVRISKGVIANTKQVRSIETEFSGNFTLFFLSGNKDILSRNYVKDFRKAIGLES
jgi:DNA-binding LytR/AlgR family response regulator